MLQHEHRTRETLSGQRRAGVCLHITSLPGRYGIGEIGSAARRFVDAAADMELRVWQVLPCGPTAYGDSPYQALSTFAGNELLIDTGDLLNDNLVTAGDADRLASLPEIETDYGVLVPRKNALLERAGERFDTHASAALRTARDEFLHAADATWLHDYALFRILKRSHDGRPWTEWETDLVRREPEALRRTENRFRAELERVKTLQFLFHDQWQRLRHHAASRGVSLFGDVPIYIALDSTDAWANREIVELDQDGHPARVAGVPPDYFSADGQLWGNPLYDWQRHAEDGYAWWVKRLARATELTDLVRIDHFRGFEAYWAIPADASTARHGEWLPGPGDALFDALQKTLGRLPIVAEDLGVITPAVEALRDRHGLPGMRVLQFEVDDVAFDPQTIPDNCVCYTGTHDNDTTLGWFRGSPNDLRDAQTIERTQMAALAFTKGNPDHIHTDMIRQALATRARLAIAPMQDYLGLGSEARLNTPGTAANNWRWRMLDAQLNDPLSAQVGQMVADADRA